MILGTFSANSLIYTFAGDMPESIAIETLSCPNIFVAVDLSILIEDTILDRIFVKFKIAFDHNIPVCSARQINSIFPQEIN